MNALILNYEFPPLGGGAGNATYYLLKEYTKRKDLNVVLITSSVSGHKEEDFSDNVKIYYLNIGKDNNLHSQSNRDLLVYSWKAFWFARKIIKTDKINLVHAFFGIPCGFLAMFLGRPYIVSLRGTDVPFYNKKYKLADMFLFKYLSFIVWKKSFCTIANSEDLKKLALLSSPLSKIEVIPNGVNINEFFPVKKNKRYFTILSTSRLIARKGLAFLIEAFLKLNKEFQDTKLVLVGDGGLFNGLKDLVRKNNALNNVDFLGRVEHRLIGEFYQKADIFVLASENEGMSNSLLEAMASGLAIISTRTSGASELVKKNGVLVDYGSSDEIYSALKQMYLNKDLLDKMKIASREASLKYSWEEAAGKYINFYNKCAE